MSRARASAQTARADDVHPAADAGADDRLGQGRRRQVVDHGQPRGRARGDRSHASACSTPTSGASPSAGCSACSGEVEARGGQDDPARARRRRRPRPRCCRWACSPRATQALLWRGLIVQKAVAQFIEDADWSGIDYFVDRHASGHRRHRHDPRAPPAPDGSARRDDARARRPAVAARAADFARKSNIRVLGVIENMSALHVLVRRAPRTLRRRRRSAPQRGPRRAAAGRDRTQPAHRRRRRPRRPAVARRSRRRRLHLAWPGGSSTTSRRQRARSGARRGCSTPSPAPSRRDLSPRSRRRPGNKIDDARRRAHDARLDARHRPSEDRA